MTTSFLIDTHCHLHDREFFTSAEAETFLKNAHNNHVRQIISIGTNPEDSKNACAFAASHENVYWTYGIHPEFATSGKSWDSKIAFFAENLRRARAGDPLQSDETPVAIGEIGLDYHYDGYDRSAQLRLFEQMLSLAVTYDLPVSLHIREAFDDAFGVIDNFPGLKGVVHSFTGNKRELNSAITRGFYIGVNGLATYTTPPLPPLEKMLLETDAPFLTPVPFRSTMNQPAYIRNIAEYLSGKLGVAETLIAEQTTNNAIQLFKLKNPS